MRKVRRQIDAAAEEVRVFVENDAQQSDGGRLRHGVGLEVAAHRLGAASHEIDAQLGSLDGRFRAPG